VKLGRILGVWAVCGLAALGLGAGVVRWLAPGSPMKHVWAGWALGSLYGLAGLILKGLAVGMGAKGFLRWGVAAESLRLFGLAVVLLALRWARPDEFEPVGLAAVAGALAFMAGEIWCVMRAG
jgi:hypothetical protein